MSLYQRIGEFNIEFIREKVSSDELLSKKSEQMVYAIMLKDNSNKLYQILYAGNCVLDILKIKKELCNNEIKMCEDFYPSMGITLKIERFTPIISQKINNIEIETYFDFSIFKNEKIHIAADSSLSGIWIKSIDLNKIYQNAKSVNVSTISNYKDSYLKNNDLLTLNKTSQYKKIINKLILLDSTKIEIQAILSMNNLPEEDYFSIFEEIANIDYLFYGYLLKKYFKKNCNKKFFPTTNDIIRSLGIENILNDLRHCLNSNDYLITNKKNSALLSSTYMYIAEMEFIIFFIISKLNKEKKRDISSNAVLMLCKIIGYQTSLWLCIEQEIGDNIFHEQFMLNKHCFLEEIQSVCMDFNQSEICSFMMNENKFPILIKDIINNHKKPIIPYDEGTFLSNLMYVVRANLYTKRFYEVKRFLPIKTNIHIEITNKLNIKEDIDNAFDQLDNIKPIINRLIWRFN